MQASHWLGSLSGSGERSAGSQGAEEKLAPSEWTWFAEVSAMVVLLK